MSGRGNVSGRVFLEFVLWFFFLDFFFFLGLIDCLGRGLGCLAYWPFSGFFFFFFFTFSVLALILLLFAPAPALGSDTCLFV